MAESIHARRATAPAVTLDADTLIPVSNIEIGEVATLAELATAVGGKVGLKVYRALLTQAGTAAPTATVLENSLGATIDWTRSDPGQYDGHISVGDLPLAKTFAQISQNNPVTAQPLTLTAFVEPDIHEQIQIITAIITFDAEALVVTATDGLLTSTPVAILVYP